MLVSGDNTSGFGNLQQDDPSASATIPEAERAVAVESIVSVVETERLAEAEFRRTLELDENNLLALESLVELAYESAAESPDPEKHRRLAAAATLYDRLTAALADDSLKKLAGSLATLHELATRSQGTGDFNAASGELIETTVRPVLDRANHSLKGSGPLPSAIREVLQGKYNSVINDGVAEFQRALQLDAQNDVAMIGMSYLIRDRAALRDTQAEYSGDIALADAWMNRGMDTRVEKARLAAAGSPTRHSVVNDTGGRIRVCESEQKAKLIRSVRATYPPAAIQAGVTGTVRFSVTIGRDGSLKESQPLSGNALLFSAARDSLNEWVWKPTFVNGIAVEIDTEVEVQFF